MIMIPYVSRTGGRNLVPIRKRGWRLLVSAKGVHRTEGLKYALDNGAWSSFQAGEPFDEGAFLDVVSKLGPGADFVVIPDIVQGGLESLAFSLDWIDDLRALPKSVRLLVAVQDDMTAGDLRPLLDERVGIFVGGSTKWKELSLPTWAELSAERRCYLHVGRVNTMRRIHHCSAHGVDSFDGSGPALFSREMVSRWERALAAPALPLGGKRR